MSNYNFVEALIQDGLAMLQTSFVYGEFAKQVPPTNMTLAQEKRYRYSLFTNVQSYQQWVNSVMAIGLDESDAIAVFGEVKQASYRFLANYRAGKFQQPTTQVTEVVVDESNRIAALEAQVAELKELSSAQSKLINSQERLISHLTNEVKVVSKAKPILRNNVDASVKTTEAAPLFW